MSDGLVRLRWLGITLLELCKSSLEQHVSFAIAGNHLSRFIGRDS